jgi:hypothetical protein
MIWDAAKKTEESFFGLAGAPGAGAGTGGFYFDVACPARNNNNEILRPAPNGKISAVSGNGAAALRPGPIPKGPPTQVEHGAPGSKGIAGSSTFRGF